MVAYQAVLKTSERALLPRNAYDMILKHRATAVGFDQFQPDDDRQRALTRLFCIARTSSPAEAKRVKDAFYCLDETEIDDLTNGLSWMGSAMESPSFLTTCLRSLRSRLRIWKESPRRSSFRRFCSIMRFLIRVYAGTQAYGRGGRLDHRVQCWFC